MNLLSIDPAPTESGYCIVDMETYKPIEFGKISNYRIMGRIEDAGFDECCIEMIGHYGTGMPAGKTVYDTCIWIGRFIQCLHHERPCVNAELIMRATVKTGICGQAKAKDANVIQALKDRFGDKGTIKHKGFFFGFHSDIWQAFALGVYYLDTMKGEV